MFHGIFTALATPMKPDGRVDFPALERLVHAQVAAGVHGFVVLGTTAETPTLSAEEKNEIIRFCKERIPHTCRLIIGTGANSTQAAVANTQAAQQAEPDGVLVVTPYYNKPNLSGLIAHFTQVAAVGLPVVLYHIPGRTGLKLSAMQLGTLLNAVPQIVGIKDADYDLARVAETAVGYAGKKSLLCGNDDLFPAYLSLGFSGIISAAANIVAPAFVKIYALWKAGKTDEAFRVFARVYPLIKACYAETNPTCIKYMLGSLGYGTQTVRSPLGEISSEHKAQLDALLAAAPADLLIKG